MTNDAGGTMGVWTLPDEVFASAASSVCQKSHNRYAHAMRLNPVTYTL